MKLNVKKIKLEMERAGWGQSELGRHMGRSRQWIWWALNASGNHTFAIVEEFAKVFQVDPKDLIE